MLILVPEAAYLSWSSVYAEIPKKGTNASERINLPVGRVKSSFLHAFDIGYQQKMWSILNSKEPDESSSHYK